MTIENGKYVSESVEDILDVMLADAREYFDEDINDSEASVIRSFYAPIAIEFAQLQDDLGLVLESSQIDNADGKALDLLTALVGVVRTPAQYSKGEATFSRSTPSDTVDYVIPAGTKVQTDTIDPVAFRTTESGTLLSGSSSVTIPIKSVEAGVSENVSSNTLTVMTNAPSGIESVTNPAATGGGINQEPDNELRERAKEELAEGSRATQAAMLQAINSLAGVKAVSIFPNGDENNLGTLPGFELVVQGGNDSEIGQKILDTKASGDHTYSGNFGTGVSTSPELPNGQTQTERFTRPTNVTVYVEASVTTDNSFLGDDGIKDAVVNYIGGTTTGGNVITGEVTTGTDVLYGEVEYSIRDVRGVYDVTDLQISVTSPASGTTNISIAEFEVASTDALAGNVTINSTPK